MGHQAGLVRPVVFGELGWGVPWEKGASGANTGNLRNLGGELGKERRTCHRIDRCQPWDCPVSKKMAHAEASSMKTALGR